MTKRCGGCDGRTCPDCRKHVHDWEGHHYCHTEARREIGQALEQFVAALAEARAVEVGGGFHAVDCRTVKAHLTAARGIIASDEAAYCSWSPWRLVYDERAVGYRNRCCSPPVLIQKPTPHIRYVRRLTGLGWPGDDGRCPKGRLPRWTREAS